ncbi:MAG: hypothetical protein A2231_08145 [Candidatus Firestonebacteria bacterium RIFOXYA2_FULL_40_8]|nr:MAG: hypothetical protein A2231_08145 [Candidatus Firestonebacteria bacterium RIFOXYA2_FULL_40_8]
MDLNVIVGAILVITGLLLVYHLIMRFLFRKGAFRYANSKNLLPLKYRWYAFKRMVVLFVTFGALFGGVTVLVMHYFELDLFPAKKSGVLIENTKSLLMEMDPSYKFYLSDVRIARWQVLDSKKSSSIYNEKDDVVKITANDITSSACQIAHEVKHRQQYKEKRGGRTVENEVEAWKEELRIYEKLAALGYINMAEEYKLKVLKRDEREFREMIYRTYKEKYELE